MWAKMKIYLLIIYNDITSDIFAISTPTLKSIYRLFFSIRGSFIAHNVTHQSPIKLKACPSRSYYLPKPNYGTILLEL